MKFLIQNYVFLLALSSFILIVIILSLKARQKKHTKRDEYVLLCQIYGSLSLTLERILLNLADMRYFQDPIVYKEKIKNNLIREISEIRDHEAKLSQYYDAEYIIEKNNEYFWNPVISEFKKLMQAFEEEDENLEEIRNNIIQKANDSLLAIKNFYSDLLRK
jgi:hypothetical protein